MMQSKIGQFVTKENVATRQFHNRPVILRRKAKQENNCVSVFGDFDV